MFLRFHLGVLVFTGKACTERENLNGMKTIF